MDSKLSKGKYKIKRICSICDSDKSYLSKRKNGKYFEQWNRLNGKSVCRKCHNRIDEKYKANKRRTQKKYYYNNPEKVKAHRIAKGLAGKQCENCGIENVRLEGHHFDYSQPDKVVTLCVKCHKRIHKNGE